VDCQDDYCSVNRTINFTHEQRTGQQCLNVKTCNDSNNEEMEYFNVTLAVPSGELFPRIVVDPNASLATVFIQDDDGMHYNNCCLNVLKVASLASLV